jgi:hypothetical protein
MPLQRSDAARLPFSQRCFGVRTVKRPEGRASNTGSRCARQQGVALILTLIMLAVITFLTVAFLTLTRRERGATSTSQSQTDARLAAQAGEARAQGEILSRIMAHTNMLVGDFLVSQNFINPIGFVQGQPFDPNNVNYDYLAGSPPQRPLLATDWIINLGNLMIDPRPPVFIQTNSSPAFSNDFRFYYDANRNGHFDTNGFITEIFSNAPPGAAIFARGEPEWIGLLQRPEMPHSGSNYFIGRYLFQLVPEGNLLDLNWMHNYAKGNVPNGLKMTQNGDGFMRNEGFGNWELNLAGFLYHLNTNYWGGTNYNYYPFIGSTLQANNGVAFDDALSILKVRYNNAYNLPDAYTSLGMGLSSNQFVYEFTNDFIDAYANGPLLLTNDFLKSEDPEIGAGGKGNPNPSWPGSRNPNLFGQLEEIFRKDGYFTILTNFQRRLNNAISQTNTYDNYTFSRLQAQVSVNTHPATNYTVVGPTFKPAIGLNGDELRFAKISLNYDNLTATNNLLTPTNALVASPTNFLQWEPIVFFTNVAQRLIEQELDRTIPTNYSLGGIFVGTNFALTNIQVYPTNLYTLCSPTLHRLLQVAANIYAAGTNGMARTNRSNNQLITNLPYVFRPVFSAVTNTNGINIIISGYEDASVWQAGVPITNTWFDTFLDLNAATNRAKIPFYPSHTTNTTVCGVPWVVSAKKHYPNFNEFSCETIVEITRKMELLKNKATDTDRIKTNQMYLVGITNVVFGEFWNSYFTNYTRPTIVLIQNDYTASITNGDGLVLWATNATNFSRTFVQNFQWMDAQGMSGLGNNWKRAFLTTPTNMPARFAPFLPGSQLTNYGRPGEKFQFVNNFNPALTNNSFFERRDSDWFYLPVMGMTMTNRVFALILDAAVSNVIDFVNIDRFVSHLDITRELGNPNASFAQAALGTASEARQLWDTNRINGKSWNDNGTMSYGMNRQMMISKGDVDVGSQVWNDYAAGGSSKINEIDGFKKFLAGATPDIAVQTPFNPTVRFYQLNDWQANDPLVHYTARDLMPLEPIVEWRPLTVNSTSAAANDLQPLNHAYRPWGGRRDRPWKNGAELGATVEESDYNPGYKDPLVRWSEDWDFPTNKFPSIGWLGRVHRGTPWQTVYLKSAVVDTNQWATNWAGAFQTHPTNDWRLLDMFTVAPYENAARGLLSVNQTNIAAWSAALCGVIVISNSLPDNQLSYPGPPAYVPQTIEPYPRPGTNSVIETFVNAINDFRTNKVAGLYNSLGEVFAVPELTLASPFLNTNSAAQTAYGISDAAYERIPQQIASLLKVGESRFVLYTRGQSLKPAANAILQSPPPTASYLQNICTNYQITGEVVTRTVLRIDGSPTKPRVVIESYSILSED